MGAQLAKELSDCGQVAGYPKLEPGFWDCDEFCVLPGLLIFNAGDSAPDPAWSNLIKDKDRLVIGEVVEGLDVLEVLNALPTRLPSTGRDLSGLASLYGLKAGVGLGVIGIVGRVPGLQGLGSLGFNVGRGALGLGAAAFVGGDDPRIRARELDDRPLSKVRLARVKVL